MYSREVSLQMNCCKCKKKKKTYVGELTANNGFNRIVYVPGIVQVCISTYCPLSHIFYLTLELDDGGNSLVIVDVQNKTVMGSVEVADAIEILMWDYTEDVMYAWVASEQYAGELVTLDLKTGKRLSTIVQFPDLSANGGTAALDVKTKTVYSSLLNIADGANTPVWVVVEIASKNATTQPTDPGLGFPINLVFY